MNPEDPEAVASAASSTANSNSNDVDDEDDVSSGDGYAEAAVSPEMLFKLCKKIAQLTKVIYSLNTKNDDLEAEFQQQGLAGACRHQLSLASAYLQQEGRSPDGPQDANDDRHHCPELAVDASRQPAEPETAPKSSRPCRGSSSGLCCCCCEDLQLLRRRCTELEDQNNRAEKLATETEAQLRKREGQNLDLRIERGVMERDLAELRAENGSLQAELSTARIRLNYDSKKAGLTTFPNASELSRAGKLAKVQEELRLDREGTKPQEQQLEQSDEDHQVQRQQMGQNSDKLRRSEEDQLLIQALERERDDLRRQCEDLVVRVEAAEAARRAAGELEARLGQLERALEEARMEREEILDAAGKEIEVTRDRALQVEQKLMDDFEWKLREVEADWRARARAAEAEANLRSRTKDEELAKAAAERVRLLVKERDEEVRILQASWAEEQARLNREVRLLQRRVDSLPDEVAKASRAAKLEVAGEVRRQAQLLEEDHARRVAAASAEWTARVQDLEAQLEAVRGARTSAVFQIRDEVELEFTERMEQLRNMYRAEIEAQSERLEAEREAARGLEATLGRSVAELRREVDDLNAYSLQREEEHEVKVTELLTRLQEQTTRAARLQEELDSYEWYEEQDSEQAAPPGGGDGSRRPPSSASKGRREVMGTEDEVEDDEDDPAGSGQAPLAAADEEEDPEDIADAPEDIEGPEDVGDDEQEGCESVDEDLVPDPPPRKDREQQPQLEQLEGHLEEHEVQQHLQQQQQQQQQQQIQQQQQQQQQQPFTKRSSLASSSTSSGGSSSRRPHCTHQ